jgi:hypothetical protein
MGYCLFCPCWQGLYQQYCAFGRAPRVVGRIAIRPYLLGSLRCAARYALGPSPPRLAAETFPETSLQGGLVWRVAPPLHIAHARA